MSRPVQHIEKSPVKRAKTLGEQDIRRIAFDVQHEAHGLRNLVAFYLSFYCALRASEIARLEWKKNVLDAKGRVAKRVAIGGDIAKRGNGGDLDIPLPLREALTMLREARPSDKFVFYALDDRNVGRSFEAQQGLKPNSVVKFFIRLYERYGYDGMSSHSGRRSAITQFSRLSAKTGKHSFLDVMNFARHKNADTTLAYIEPNDERGEIIESMWGQGEITNARRTIRQQQRERAFA